MSIVKVTAGPRLPLVLTPPTSTIKQTTGHLFGISVALSFDLSLRVPRLLILYLLHVIKPLHLTHPPTCTMQLLNCFKSVSTSPLEVRHTPTPLLIMCTASALPIRYLTSALTLKDLQLVNREWFSLTSHPCYKHTHTHKPISESLRGFLIELHEFVLRPHRLSL